MKKMKSEQAVFPNPCLEEEEEEEEEESANLVVNMSSKIRCVRFGC
jgi:hypothetical protein